MAGFFIHSQNTRIQLSLSRVDPRATASALNVLRTTRGIFFEDQAIGQTTVFTFSSNPPSVEKIIVRVDCPFPVSKQASENAQNVTCCSLIGTIIKLTEWDLASYKTLFAVIKCSILPLVTAVWSSPTFAARSGLVCTLAYWRLPQICRSCCTSTELKGLWGFCLRLRGISMGWIRWI